ncbi:hypothetical protein T492DRAFT_281374 [Pavlovales sp. CCMP2436]|nr:hypothetical protein T492DRAFT_281374 [Pavlovales sp. CCMP2436]
MGNRQTPWQLICVVLCDEQQKKNLERKLGHGDDEVGTERLEGKQAEQAEGKNALRTEQPMCVCVCACVCVCWGEGRGGFFFVWLEVSKANSRVGGEGRYARAPVRLRTRRRASFLEGTGEMQLRWVSAPVESRRLSSDQRWGRYPCARGVSLDLSVFQRSGPVRASRGWTFN